MTYQSKYAPDDEVWVNVYDYYKKRVAQMKVKIWHVDFYSDGQATYGFECYRFKRDEKNVYATEAEAAQNAEEWAKEVGYEEYL
jgi:hypothetical protein